MEICVSMDKYARERGRDEIFWKHKCVYRKYTHTNFSFAKRLGKIFSVQYNLCFYSELFYLTRSTFGHKKNKNISISNTFLWTLCVHLLAFANWFFIQFFFPKIWVGGLLNEISNINSWNDCLVKETKKKNKKDRKKVLFEIIITNIIINKIRVNYLENWVVCMW